MKQVNLYNEAQDDLDRLFREGRHAPGGPQRGYLAGENRAQRRARERKERRAAKKVKA